MKNVRKLDAEELVAVSVESNDTAFVCVSHESCMRKRVKHGTKADKRRLDRKRLCIARHSRWSRSTSLMTKHILRLVG